jgi:hypothetical protein
MQLSHNPVFRDMVEKLDNQIEAIDNEVDHIRMIAPEQLVKAEREADLIKGDLLWLKQTIINKKESNG